MKIAIILLAFMLTACSTTQPKTIQIPVPVACAKPSIPAEPVYPISSLKSGDKLSMVAKAYVATVALQSSYIEQLKHILGDY